MKTIEIKNINGDVIFKHTAENNSIKLTVEEAVKNDINLALADLCDAELDGAILIDANLRGANLRNTSLKKADLAEANLVEANLAGANLERANLSWADLADANLKEANLKDANLKGAFLEGANLEGTELLMANLSGANLKDANLKGSFIDGANIYEAGLNGAKNIPFIPLACPSEGAFIGWKKVEGKYLIKIQIPEDARRLSATTRECRCDKAKVLDITSLDGNKHYDEVTNNNYNETIYKVGEMVYPDSFDENRWNECSHGIHFFVNKEDAINY